MTKSLPIAVVCSILISLLPARSYAELAITPEGYPEQLPHPRDDNRLLGLRLWVIETKPLDRDIITATMEEHIRYQLKLERQGIMFAAGPIYAATAKKPDGNGLIVIRAENVEQAMQIAAADPMHASGGRSFTLRQWRVNEGSITVTIPFSRYHSPTIK